MIPWWVPALQINEIKYVIDEISGVALSAVESMEVRGEKILPCP